jgi:nitrite reductase (cytochrome c-552)
MKSISDQISKRPWVGWVLFFVTLGIVFVLGLLAASIIERRTEADLILKPQIAIDENEPRNEIWGQNYPKEYNSYMQTADTGFKSLYNGNCKIDMLEKYPELVVLWAGYAFSKEYNQARGHYYALTDIYDILRTGGPKDAHDGPQPNTCWTCKSPDVPRMMKLLGSAADFYKGKWASRGAEIVNFIGCADCHDAKTMNLRISRPALVEAFQRMGKDITKASQQEMRSLVCAQCHVEYYFKGDDKYLTFPWDKGWTVEDMEKYYDENQHVDWVHQLSRTPMLKAQHPDFEIFTTGIHYKRGVSCADCHMPFISEGGQKFSNHKIMSPLANISNSCQVCHRQSDDSLRNNVYDRQRKVAEIRIQLEVLLCKAHYEAKAAWDAKATENEMKPVLTLIRQAQWRWDFVGASHGASFHAPIECLRILSNGILKVQDARLLLASVLTKHNVKQPVPMPDFSTKIKAQQLIGIDMDKLKKEKQEFKNNLLPQWLKEAKERESKMPVPKPCN